MTSAARWIRSTAVLAALGFSALGCHTAQPTIPTNGSNETPVGACSSPRAIEATWESFREHHPFHSQEVAASDPDAGGCRTIILSEPPPGVDLGSLNDIHPSLGKLAVRRHRIGVDGYVEDFIGQLPSVSDDELAEITSRLHISLFGTAYRARLAPIAPAAEPKTKLDIEVRPAELYEWVFGSEAMFWPVDGGPRERANDLFDPSQTGVFLSSSPGVVLWSFPKTGDFADQKANVRIFGVESDLVLGAVADEDTVVVIGRERVAPLETLPPLRFESVQILARTPLTQLAQSYERTQLLAGAVSGGMDWAPILLSPAIVDTEVGSVLNIADQLLKRWSEAMTISYEGFRYPGEPAAGPFAKGIVAELQAPVLTFNWNTALTGALSPLADGKKLYWMHRTGALNVSYLPGDRPDPRTAMYEDKARDFFAAQSDPHIVRAVQHATLFQAFRQLGVTTSDPIVDLEDKLAPDAANDTLVENGAAAIERLESISEADMKAAFAAFVDRDMGAVDKPTEEQIQEVLARVPLTTRAQIGGQLRAKLLEKWPGLVTQIKTERVDGMITVAHDLRKKVVAAGSAEAPHDIALALVLGPVSQRIAADPALFRAAIPYLKQPAAQKRAAAITDAVTFLKAHQLDQIDPDAWRDVLAALVDLDVVEGEFRKARNDRVTESHVRTPSVVRSSSGGGGAHGGHNVGASVPRIEAAVRPVDLAHITLDRSGLSMSTNAIPARPRTAALVAVPERVRPSTISLDSKPPPPPDIPESGWARQPAEASEGCGSGCVLIGKYDTADPEVGKSGARRARFRFEMDGVAGRAGSMVDVVDGLHRALSRKARLNRPKVLTVSLVVRDAHVTPAEAMALADSAKMALMERHLDAKSGFVIDKVGRASLTERYNLANAVVSPPKKVGAFYEISVSVPQKENFVFRLLSKTDLSTKLRSASDLPSGLRPVGELATELRKTIDPDLLMELASDAQGPITDNEQDIQRSRYAGESSPTF
ncbi:MAG: hypothetical protein U0441_05670 [Polyangiaceae bacterium]